MVLFVNQLDKFSIICVLIHNIFDTKTEAKNMYSSTSTAGLLLQVIPLLSLTGT